MPEPFISWKAVLAKRRDGGILLENTENQNLWNYFACIKENEVTEVVGKTFIPRVLIKGMKNLGFHNIYADNICFTVLRKMPIYKRGRSENITFLQEGRDKSKTK